MQVARVIGNVVSSTKSFSLEGLKLLLVQPLDVETLADKGAPLVAIDGVGAGNDEIVILVGGSSSRNCDECRGTPSDLAILGILDSLDVKGKRVYEKHPSF